MAVAHQNAAELAGHAVHSVHCAVSVRRCSDLACCAVLVMDLAGNSFNMLAATAAWVAALSISYDSMVDAVPTGDAASEAEECEVLSSCGSANWCHLSDGLRFAEFKAR